MARKTKNDNNKQRKIKYFTSPDTLGRLKRRRGGGGGSGSITLYKQRNQRLHFNSFLIKLKARNCEKSLDCLK